jgi:alkylated DNA repair dioxygenase AlkB
MPAICPSVREFSEPDVSHFFPPGSRLVRLCAALRGVLSHFHPRLPFPHGRLCPDSSLLALQSTYGCALMTDVVPSHTVEISSHATRVTRDSFHTTLLELPRGTLPRDPEVAALLEALPRELDGVFLDRTSAFMKYRGHALKRDKAFFVDSPSVTEAGEPDELYPYHYPGFQLESLLHYHAVSSMPSLQRLLALLHTYTFQGQPMRFNHVIATRYRNGDDAIGWHADKMRDIAPGTPIVSLSLGATRDLQLRAATTSEKDPASETIPLRHGDLFVLGPETNRHMQHRVPPVRITTAAEVGAAPLPRISLVFRNIHTRVSRDDVLATVKRSADRKARKRARERDATSAAADPAPEAKRAHVHA